MKHTIETIKKALNHHSETQDAISFGYLNSQIREFEKELREKYAELCKTRVTNIADDAVAFFIEKLLDQEPEEILG